MTETPRTDSVCFDSFEDKRTEQNMEVVDAAFVIGFLCGIACTVAAMEE